jgi:hypothetical protein
MSQARSPIFVVGSPRSGTSILTWCLGQHPNILALEESNWLDGLSYSLQHCYATGSSRGERSQLSALKVSRPAFFEAFAAAVHEIVFGHRHSYEAARSQEAIASSTQLAGIEVSRSSSDPKRRWVDGTPEYSLAIPGIKTLFADAKFIHLVRDVESVVKSMLTFHRFSGIRLVGTEQEAYEYWLRTVRACLEAERAYGSNVVMRVRFQDLVASPEATLASICDFLDEPYSPHCIEPLEHRINSSAVPETFQSFDPQTEPSIRESARRLSEQLSKETAPNYSGCRELTAHIDQAFVSRSFYLGNCDRQLVASNTALAEAERELGDYRQSSLWERARELIREHTPYDACIATVGSLATEHNAYLDRFHVPLLSMESFHKLSGGLAAVQRELATARERGCGYLLLLPDAVRWMHEWPKLRKFLDDNFQRFDGPLRQIALYKLDQKKFDVSSFQFSGMQVSAASLQSSSTEN